VRVVVRQTRPQSLDVNQCYVGLDRIQTSAGRICAKPYVESRKSLGNSVLPDTSRTQHVGDLLECKFSILESPHGAPIGEALGQSTRLRRTCGERNSRG